MQMVLPENPGQPFNWIQFCDLVGESSPPHFLGEQGGLQSDQGVLCLTMSLLLPLLLNFLGLSSSFPSHSCPHAQCQLLPFQQLRVKVEVANYLRKKDLGWEQILLQRKPRGHISKYLFLFPSLGCLFGMVLMTENVNCLCSFNMVANKCFWEIQGEILPHWRVVFLSPKLEIWATLIPSPSHQILMVPSQSLWNLIPSSTVLQMLTISSGLSVQRPVTESFCSFSSRHQRSHPETPKCYVLPEVLWCSLMSRRSNLPLGHPLLGVLPSLRLPHIRPEVPAILWARGDFSQLLQGLFLSLKCTSPPSWMAHFSSSDNQPRLLP